MKFSNQPTNSPAAQLGLRWQGGSRDTAFAPKNNFRAVESGVALRFPPHSMTGTACK